MKEAMKKMEIDIQRKKRRFEAFKNSNIPSNLYTFKPSRASSLSSTLKYDANKDLDKNLSTKKVEENKFLKLRSRKKVRSFSGMKDFDFDLNYPKKEILKEKNYYETQKASYKKTISNRNLREEILKNDNLYKASFIPKNNSVFSKRLAKLNISQFEKGNKTNMKINETNSGLISAPITRRSKDNDSTYMKEFILGKLVLNRK